MIDIQKMIDEQRAKDWGAIPQKTVAALLRAGIPSVTWLMEYIEGYGLTVDNRGVPCAIIDREGRYIFGLSPKAKGWQHILEELERRGFDWVKHVRHFHSRNQEDESLMLERWQAVAEIAEELHAELLPELPSPLAQILAEKLTRLYGITSETIASLRGPAQGPIRAPARDYLEDVL